jgi:hypothetical protein
MRTAAQSQNPLTRSENASTDVTRRAAQPPAGTMKIAVARKRKKIEPPKPDVAEKIDAGFTHGEFDRALKVTKRQLDDSSGRDPKSPRTSA